MLGCEFVTSFASIYQMFIDSQLNVIRLLLLRIRPNAFVFPDYKQTVPFALPNQHFNQPQLTNPLLALATRFIHFTFWLSVPPSFFKIFFGFPSFPLLFVICSFFFFRTINIHPLSFIHCFLFFLLVVYLFVF